MFVPVLYRGRRAGSKPPRSPVFAIRSGRPVPVRRPSDPRFARVSPVVTDLPSAGFRSVPARSTRGRSEPDPPVKRGAPARDHGPVRAGSSRRSGSSADDARVLGARVLGPPARGVSRPRPLSARPGRSAGLAVRRRSLSAWPPRSGRPPPDAARSPESGRENDWFLVGRTPPTAESDPDRPADDRPAEASQFPADRSGRSALLRSGTVPPAGLARQTHAIDIHRGISMFWDFNGVPHRHVAGASS